MLYIDCMTAELSNAARTAEEKQSFYQFRIQACEELFALS